MKNVYQWLIKNWEILVNRKFNLDFKSAKDDYKVKSSILNYAALIFFNFSLIFIFLFSIVSYGFTAEDIGNSKTNPTTTASVPLVGDTFSNPIDLGVITGSLSLNGNTLSANSWQNDYSTSSTPGNSKAHPSNDVFYKLTINQCYAYMNIGLCTSDFDTFLHLLDSNGNSVKFDDDNCVTPNGLASSFDNLYLDPGTYYFVVEGFNNFEGNYTLSLNYFPGSTLLTYYKDNDNDGFGNPLLTIQSCLPLAGYVTNNSDCDDANAAVNPNATDVCYDGLDNNCDGIYDNGCVPKVSQIQASQCGITLTNMDDYIYADLVAGVQGYRFKVTDRVSGEIQILDRALRVFHITQLPKYKFKHTYSVEVGVRYNNVWQPFFGAPCTINTPEVFTKVRAEQCGFGLEKMTDIIYADLVEYTPGYNFRITDVATSQQIVVERPIRDIRLTNFPNPKYETNYMIEVAVKNTDGTFLAYGEACQITSPKFPTVQLQTSDCDKILTDMNTTIYANSFVGATTYRFKFTSNSGQVLIIDRPLRSVRVSSIPGILSGTSYSVQVSIEIGGIFGGYGKVCTVTTPGSERTNTSNEETIIVSDKVPVDSPLDHEVVKFNVVAFPNPFLVSFKIKLETDSNKNVFIKIYNSFGNLIEEKEFELADVNILDFGESYLEGVYYVVVTQGDYIKKLKVIKK